jgi:dolichol kinase
MPPPQQPRLPFESHAHERRWFKELRRKLIHMAFILLPLQMIFRVAPWPRTDAELRIFLFGFGFVMLGVDLLRLHHREARYWFRRFFGEMVRKHERMSLLGSSYIVLAALIALAAFPRDVAAAALGFTILGDAFAALVGKAVGKTPLFGKTLEGALGGLAMCLLWGWVVVSTGTLSWDIVVAGALVASLVELLPIPLDDNLGMTLASGITMLVMGSTV